MEKRIIVVYKSVYGATRTYAEWIAQALDARVAPVNDITSDNLSEYDVIVYGGGLYVGRIAGVKLVRQTTCKNLVIFTVGLADPKNTDYGTIYSSLSPELRAKAKIFHLHGGIDYKRLNLVHKVMMAVNKRDILKKPASEHTDEDRRFIETYGCRVDFYDKTSIKPLVDYVQSLAI